MAPYSFLQHFRSFDLVNFHFIRFHLNHMYISTLPTFQEDFFIPANIFTTQPYLLLIIYPELWINMICFEKNLR